MTPLLRTSLAAACAVVFGIGIALPGCGGGGGGGGSDGGGGTTAGGMVMAGIVFRLPDGTVLETPPVMDLTGPSPGIGAPLNVTVLFLFTGQPEGQLSQGSLPVYTTPTLMDPAFVVAGTPNTVLAKGTYVYEGEGLFGPPGLEQLRHVVAFQPYVPTVPLDLSPGALDEAIPGLLPGSQYIAKVNDSTGKLDNLVGPGGNALFGTTGSSVAYYPPVVGGTPPALVSSDPSTGATGFGGTLFAASGFGGSQAPSVPPGPNAVHLFYDGALVPTTTNLDGTDVDGDGVVDPMFALRVAATSLLVGSVVPADALSSTIGSHAAFPAVSGLSGAPDPTGGDVVLHAGPLPDPDPGLTVVPKSMASGAEPALLFLVLKGADGVDRLTVADHLLGDPTHAALALDADGGAPVALDTGLTDVVGLTTLVDGRLVAYDRGDRRIHELLPTVERRRPTATDPVAGPPLLTELELGDAGGGFVSAPLDASVSDVLDLAVAPSGRLYALAQMGDDPFPSLVRLVPIDPGGTGTFAPEAGQPAEVVLVLSTDYAGVELSDVLFVSETELFALNRTDDTVDRIDLGSGKLDVEIAGVGAFGMALGGLPGGLSPARSLAFGRLDLAAEARLVSNTSAGAEVIVSATGVLPAGVDVTVVQRHDLLALSGANAATAQSSDPLPRLGVTGLVTVTTAEAVGTDIDDAFLEEFLDTELEDAVPDTSPIAEWAEISFNQQSSGGLRASVGVGEAQLLGDFMPVATSAYNPDSPWTSTAAEGEADLEPGIGYKIVNLSTDAQSFPMADGSTPGVTAPVTVSGGKFVFRDFIIPEGVHVVVTGSNPLVITATRKVEISGLLDVKGKNGFSDDSFDTGFVPVPAGPGGPGGGKGGDGHPTLFDPQFNGTVDQFVTPETGEQGWGPVVSPGGSVTFQKVGGSGGLSTLGYNPSATGFPKLDPAVNIEMHRPPGGGGGSFYISGLGSHSGAGTYLVQSESTWSPYSKCPTDDKIQCALYGNDENIASGLFPNHSLQCVYMVGSPSNPERIVSGAQPGDLVFKDGDPSNDFIGPGAEIEVLIGGQGGGGGGSRIDSMRHKQWSISVKGAPSPTGPPFYPVLFGPPRYSATLFDAKGAGGGGGGGAVLIRSFGDIVITRVGHIDASGGHGGGGERLSNSGADGGGGGGSGGAILLHAAGQIVLEADETHQNAAYVDPDGSQGASLDVSGGMGRDAQTSPQTLTGFSGFSFDYSRGDGGQGGFGLIQMQAGGGEPPVVQPGAFAFANVRSILKMGTWSGDGANKQAEHPDAFNGMNPSPDELRYIDMLHYRSFNAVTDGNAKHIYYTLNGTYPPIIPTPTGAPVPAPVLVNEHPEGSGSFWMDTAMIEYPQGSGRYVVQEPEAWKVMKTYNGWDPDTWKEFNNPASDPLFPATPGTTYAYDEDPIPMFLAVIEPDGTPLMVDVDGEQQFDPDNLIDRLPVVPFDKTPPPFGTISRGTSRWIDFQGVTIRARDDGGRTPPFFQPVHGTYNTAMTAVPTDMDGQVMLGADVPSVPARYVENTGLFPFEPGLFGNGVPVDPPFNDIKIDAPEFSTTNAVTKNASVTLVFQGAYAIREGSSVPDPATLSPWVADLTALSGYPLVRFQVSFDVGLDVESWPFSVESFRPQVDYVRLRAQY